MILYGDTSALLKLYIDEPDSAFIEEAMGEAAAVVTHVIAYPELRAALAKAARMGRVDPEHHRELVDAVDRDWHRLHTVEPDTPLTHRAGHLAEALSLRGYDSLHLAAAEAVAAQIAPAPFRFAVFDEGLRAAARELGLATLGED